MFSTVVTTESLKVIPILSHEQHFSSVIHTRPCSIKTKRMSIYPLDGLCRDCALFISDK